MDEEDDAWLTSFNQDKPASQKISEDQFEQVMWELESLANDTMPFLSIDPSQIPPFEELESHFKKPSLLPLQSAAKHIYDHWKERRLKNAGKPIFPTLKFDETGLRSDSDPYVCFRRRETRPVRKTRRTDQQSLEKLRKLRAEMETARNLLEMVLRREKMRKESLAIEHTIFDKKCMLREMQRQLGIKEDEDLLFSKKKRKMSTESGSGATIKIPLNKLKRDGFDRHEKSAAQLAIEAEVAKRKEEDSGFEDVTDSPYQEFPIPLPSQFLRRVLPDDSISSHYEPLHSHKPCYRKRLGRGGRIHIDRIGLARQPRTHTGGKTRPSDDYERAIKRFKYDSDEMSDEEEEIDDMEDRLLRYRCQLLGEPDLRSLVTIPFINPSMTYPPGGMMVNRANAQANRPPSNVPRPGGTTATSPSLPARTINGTATSPLRRQNSRTKMTPQQQALAMTNGMIAANMAAAVNAPNKATLQLAMQQQLQQQMQANGGNLPTGMTTSLQKKMQAAAMIQQQRAAAAAGNNANGNANGMSPIQQANMLKANGQNGGMNLKLQNRANPVMQQAYNGQQQTSAAMNLAHNAASAASQASNVLQQVAALRNVNGSSPSMMNGMQTGSPLLNGSPQFTQQQLQQLQQQQKQQMAQMQAAGSYASPMLGLQSSPVMISAGGSPQQMAMQSPNMQLTAQQQQRPI
ncbi:Enhancer of polycomb-like protein 1, variant 2 [Umbelopsis sp. WA50703]